MNFLTTMMYAMKYPNEFYGGELLKDDIEFLKNQAHLDTKHA